jgi:hypothetical protein
MRKSAKDQRLSELESDFKLLLVRCLQICARGKWGLFGQHDTPLGKRYDNWPEAGRLKAMAAEIRKIRAEFGHPNATVERYIYYCSLRGPNDSGEPKLARAFLEELGLLTEYLR